MKNNESFQLHYSFHHLCPCDSLKQISKHVHVILLILSGVFHFETIDCHLFWPSTLFLKKIHNDNEVRIPEKDFVDFDYENKRSANGVTIFIITVVKAQ